MKENIPLMTTLEFSDRSFKNYKSNSKIKGNQIVYKMRRLNKIMNRDKQLQHMMFRTPNAVAKPPNFSTKLKHFFRFYTKNTEQ